MAIFTNDVAQSRKSQGEQSFFCNRKIACASVLVSVMFVVSGCLGGGLGLDSVVTPDTSLHSGSIPYNADDFSDNEVIRSTVAQADVSDGFIQDIPWLNTANGNTGTVSFIRDNSSVKKICRDFVVSKHSFDGISQYTGQICRTRLTKSWTLDSLDEQG